MRGRSATILHWESAGKDPEIRTLLESVLSGESLDNAVNAFDTLSQNNSFRLIGTGDASSYELIERETQEAFDTACRQTLAGNLEFYEQLLKIGNRKHLHSYNPFLVAMSEMELAKCLYLQVEDDKLHVKSISVGFRDDLDKLEGIILSLRENNYQKAFTVFDSLSPSFKKQRFYKVAEHCVNVTKALKDVPYDGDGESWEQARKYWLNLPSYNSQNTKTLTVLATGILGKLKSLRIDPTAHHS